jgi:hypothetical protein
MLANMFWIFSINIKFILKIDIRYIMCKHKQVESHYALAEIIISN